MKIGILTFHRSQNYGALLQAKGLQDFVKSLNHNVAFVDYWPAYHEEMYKPFSWKKLLKLDAKSKLLYLIKFPFIISRLYKRRNKTQDYYNKYLTISTDKTYDVVLYGSDQIWRKQHQPTFEYFNPVYFGEGFVNTSKKIAYAASMGKIEIDDDNDRKFLLEHFNNFDAISIRESDLIERLDHEFGLKFQQVCDPVFLLNREQWLSHTDSRYIPKYKYILYYRLQHLEQTDRMVEELVRKTGYKVIELRGHIPFFKYGERYRFTADAQEFISLINGAEYVITSAFHGIAMSIIFNKEFFFTSQKQQANRVASLLEKLGLENRFADGYVNDVNLNDRIDYKAVNKRLDAFAEESRSWLTKQIESCKEQ